MLPEFKYIIVIDERISAIGVNIANMAVTTWQRITISSIWGKTFQIWDGMGQLVQ